MKVLVLSCSTGGGHNAAALAIVEAFKKQKIECDFRDYLGILGPDISEKICHWYLSWTNGQGNVFKVIYKIGDLYSKTNFRSPVYALNKLGAKKLYQYIVDNQYDFVVTTHLYSAMALTAIKKEHHIPFAQIATDYVCIPFWQETNPDYFFIPHPDLKQDFIDKGINPDILYPLGIPTSHAFHKKIDKLEIREKLGLKNKKTILLMSGSMGFGNVIDCVKQLLANHPKLQLIVVCGNNKELKEKLKEFPSVIALGFINNVYEYMKAGDVVLTKPGGLTTTEAAVSNTPMIHTLPIPGCENYNADFFDKKGMSIACHSLEEIINNTSILLESESKRNKMIQAQRENINPKCALDICKFLIKEYEKTSITK